MRFPKTLAAAAALFAFPTLLAAQAHDYRLGDLHIDHPWSRASAGPMQGAGAAFMTIANGGPADRLVGASADVSERVELHTHILTADGVMKMREVAGGIEIPAGETVELKPGGLHVMFMGLKAPLTEGDSFPLTLTFERAGTVTVEVAIEGVAAGGHGHGGHGHGGHGHGGHGH